MTTRRALAKLAILGLEFGETEVTEDALNRLPAPAKGTAATISIQAALAITAGQFEKAESQFERATRLEPSNLNWRLDLLKLQLQFRDLAHADSARRELEALSKNPIVKTDALRALLQDARTQSELQRAAAIAEELASLPDAPLPDKLAFREELRVTSGQRFSVEIAKLREAIGSSGNPELISQVMTWQNNHGLSRESLDWAEQLPGNLMERVPVQVAQCDALMGLNEWLRLRTKVAGADWGWMNYLRLAIYARAKQANIAPAAMQSLARLAAVGNRECPAVAPYPRQTIKAPRASAMTWQTARGIACSRKRIHNSSSATNR
jgi:hypothetical protein